MDSFSSTKEEYRLFIGKIPAIVTSEEINRHFAQFGVIKDVLYPRSDKPMKIAFVTYLTKEGLDTALAQRHEFGGQELNVTRALPKHVRPPPPQLASAIAEGKKENTRIFIGGLPSEVTDSELESHFSHFGAIEKIMLPPKGTASQTYAFVTFETAQAKQAALTTTHQFKGVDVRVVEAKPKPPGASDPLATAPVVPTTEGKTETDSENTRVFVGRLPTDSTKEELREYFTAFGTVADVFRPPNQTTGSEPKAFAFVTFSDSKDMWRCLANTPHTFKGQKIEVVEARPKAPRGTPAQVTVSPTGVINEPRVFVGRIPIDVTETELKQYFSTYGSVRDIFRPKQSSNKDGYYFAFVIFESATDVARALAQENHTLPNRPGTTINVIRARPRIAKEVRESAAAAAAAAVASAYGVYPPYGDPTSMGYVDPSGGYDLNYGGQQYLPQLGTPYGGTITGYPTFGSTGGSTPLLTSSTTAPREEYDAYNPHSLGKTPRASSTYGAIPTSFQATARYKPY